MPKVKLEPPSIGCVHLTCCGLLASTTMKLENKIAEERYGGNESLMFILGVTVGAAVPLLIMAAS